MKKHGAHFYNIVLAFGMILIIAGFLLFTVSDWGAAGRLKALWPALCICVGAIFLFAVMTLTRNPYHLFFGMTLSLTGIFFTLVNNKIIPHGISEWWPLIIVFAAAALFASGCYQKRRLTVSYVFPAAMLALLGLLFLLFSFHVIHASFRAFVAVFGPFALIACGIFMVILFLLQQKYHQFYIDDETEEIDEYEAALFEQDDGR